MNTYLDAQDVVFAIAHANADGGALTPTGISLSVYDEEDELVHGPVTPTPAVGAGPTSVTIPGSANTLAEGEINGARRVRVTITTSGGSFLIPTFYLIKSEIMLIVPSNSFQSMTGALSKALIVSEMTAWDAAGETERTVALMEAYRRITQQTFRAEYTSVDSMRIITWPGESANSAELGASTFAAMTRAEYDELPILLRNALALAQVAEANDILTADPIVDRRRAGLLAESIGESSMMFKTMKPIDRGLGTRAMSYLRQFLISRVKIGRT